MLWLGNLVPNDINRSTNFSELLGNLIGNFRQLYKRKIMQAGRSLKIELVNSCNVAVIVNTRRINTSGVRNCDIKKRPNISTNIRMVINRESVSNWRGRASTE